MEQMNVLITGSKGTVGAEIVRHCQLKNLSVVEFDRADGLSLLNPEQLNQKIAGCAAVIHCAALLGRDEESSEEIMNVNLMGTYNVLLAAQRASVQKVIFLSSVGALGIFQGQGRPQYFPIDENHPCTPSTPYALSKYLAEKMCCEFSQSSGIPIIALRFPGVWTSELYELITKEREKTPTFEFEPFWEYGAFIDVRDLAEVCCRSVEVPLSGYTCVQVSSSDITTSGKTTLEWVEQLVPEIPFQDRDSYVENPYKSLLSIETAKRVLDWEPQHTWQRYVNKNRE